MIALDRISIELTNRCSKACAFCYNASGPGGATEWEPSVVSAFALDCAGHGVKAVSFGGGEPLEYPGVVEVLSALRGRMFRSLTTNGLLLDDRLDALAAVAPEKIHVSIHSPASSSEVERVIRQVDAIAARGIASGVNLLVRASQVVAATAAAARLRASGIGNDRIVYLPMRGDDTPSPREVALVAGEAPFQSMSCLARCGASPRFAAVSWDRQVAWCSYTATRRRLSPASYPGLVAALAGLLLADCATRSLTPDRRGASERSPGLRGGLPTYRAT